MALDLGERRIGVALSDPLPMLASPLTTLDVTSDEASIAAIVRLIEENEVSELVIGLPLSMSGKRGPQARAVERFVESLKQRLSIPVKMVDERLSSAEAERMIQASGRKPSRVRPQIDSTAAAIILQAYLDTRR